jgi:putative hydrolase of the HAD superfamily
MDTILDSVGVVDWDLVEWVILDMDGTILDLAYDNYFWRELVPRRYAQNNGLTLKQARERLAPKFLEVQHTLPWYCTDYWSGITGINMAELKREIRHLIGPLDGAVDFLHAVRASGRQLWLATNAHRDSWSLKLEHTGLTPLFDRIVSSHEFGAPKEDARFWRQFIEQHPFRAERALFVDDSLPVLHAAQDFGIGQVLAISHPDTTQPPRQVDGFVSIAGLRQLRPSAKKGA